MLLESYNLVAITENWWDELQDWSVAVDGYKLFKRGRRGRRGEGVALYIKKGNRVQRCLWIIAMSKFKVRIRDWASKWKWCLVSTTGHVLAPATEGTVLVGTCPTGGLQPYQHLLKRNTESFRQSRIPLYTLTRVGCITRPVGHPGKWANQEH